MAKRRQSCRKEVCEDLDLGFPIDALRITEAPRNKEVLLHLFHFLRSDIEEKQDLTEALHATRESVKTSWAGSNVQVACDKTIENRISDLHKLFR